MSSRKHVRTESSVRQVRDVHKVEQLCRQVEEAIACALTSSEDEVLRELALAAVTPFRGASCLQVTVFVDAEDPDAAARIRRRLVQAKGYLRAEIAADINRKRVPDLAFEVIPVRKDTRGDDE